MDTNFQIPEHLLTDNGRAVSPLADEVISHIFRSKEVAGLAMQGLANAILEDSGDEPISEIITMSPQEFQPEAKQRSFCLDVYAKTKNNEMVLLEVQLDYQCTINLRALLYAELPLRDSLPKGVPWREMAGFVPRIISINLLNFDLRKTNQDFHQIAEFTYRKEPRELAEGSITMHNVELPKFRRITPDLTNALHCWLTAICRSHDRQITLKEVVEMDAQLHDFYSTNPPFTQFVDQYQTANADPNLRNLMTRREIAEKMAILEEYYKMQASKLEGKREGKAEGKAETFLEQMLPLLLRCQATPEEIYEKGKQNGVSREDVQKAMDALRTQRQGDE